MQVVKLCSSHSVLNWSWKLTHPDLYDGHKMVEYGKGCINQSMSIPIKNEAGALYNYFVDYVDAAAVSTHRLHDRQQSVTRSRVQRSFTVHVGRVQQTSGTQQVY